MQSVGNRWGWKAMVLATAAVAGCESATIQRPGGARELTGIEMDHITAGAVAAVSDAKALALGSAPQTTAFTSTLANAASSPIAGAPFINYATLQAIASASNGPAAQAGGSSQIYVDGGNGGARIDANVASAATGGETNYAQINIQFTGISTSHIDLVYGSIVAVACCNPFDRTQATVDSRAGGPYVTELDGAPLSDTPGQVQSRIDAAIASSFLPILDAGKIMAVTAPSLSQSVGQ